MNSGCPLFDRVLNERRTTRSIEVSAYTETIGYLWQYPTTIPNLTQEEQRKWAHDGQSLLRPWESVQLLDIAYQYYNLKNTTDVHRRQIREAWAIEVEQFLPNALDWTQADLDLNTLEILATVAQQIPLRRAELILLDVINDPVNSRPHVEVRNGCLHLGTSSK